MTIDEFEIGKKVMYAGQECTCIDKGTKTVVLTEMNNCPESSGHWFTVKGREHQFDDCKPIKTDASYPAEAFNLAKKVLLRNVVRIDFRLEEITKAIDEIRLETGELKRNLQ